MPFFPFLDLPPEIREKIYLHTITSPTPIPLTADSTPLLSLLCPSFSHSPSSSSSSSTANQANLNHNRHHSHDHGHDHDHPLHPLFPLPLLLTSHQIYHEARPLYFTHNTFALLLVRDPSPLQYFLAPSFQDNRRRIRSLRLAISRWGRREFFLRDVAPVLEDMVLNGCLRDVEVWVRRWHLFVAGREGDDGGGGGGLVTRGARAVERLLGILRDPYLERAVLKTPVDGASRLDRHHLEIGEDLGSFIDVPMEDVTRLIGHRRRDH